MLNQNESPEENLKKIKILRFLRQHSGVFNNLLTDDILVKLLYCEKEDEVYEALNYLQRQDLIIHYFLTPQNVGHVLESQEPVLFAQAIKLLINKESDKQLNISLIKTASSPVQLAKGLIIWDQFLTQYEDESKSLLANQQYPEFIAKFLFSMLDEHHGFDKFEARELLQKQNAADLICVYIQIKEQLNANGSLVPIFKKALSHTNSPGVLKIILKIADINNELVQALLTHQNLNELEATIDELCRFGFDKQQVGNVSLISLVVKHPHPVAVFETFYAILRLNSEVINRFKYLILNHANPKELLNLICILNPNSFNYNLIENTLQEAQVKNLLTKENLEKITLNPLPLNALQSLNMQPEQFSSMENYLHLLATQTRCYELAHQTNSQLDAPATENPETTLNPKLTLRT